MAGTPRDIPTLEGWFQTGDKPTQQQFYDLFVSFVHYLQVKQVLGTSTSDVPSLNLLKTTIDALKDGVPVAGDTLNKLYNLIVGVGQLVGDFNAAPGLVPTTGTGLSGAIDKGDFWLITTGGTIAGLGTLAVGDVLYSKQANATLAAHFFYLPFSSLVGDASETVKGIIELANQTESETVNGTVGTLDHVRAITVRAWRWAWDKMLTVNQAITGVWTAPTAAPGTDTTQIATTEFVQQEIRSNMYKSDT